MSTYFVSLDVMLQAVKNIDGRQGRRAFFWEEGDGVDRMFVVEYPVTNSDGVYTGVTYRTEIAYQGFIAAILTENPAAKESDVLNVIEVFERIFLSEWFKRVDGEHVPEARPLLEYSAARS